MVTSVAALAASWMQFGRLLPVPLMTAVLVVVFGSLTFWLNDPRFIKIKPTIINLLFAGVLFFGLLTGRPLLKLLLGEAFNLTEEGWRRLSFRWALFFLGLGRAQRVGVAQLLRNGLGQLQGVRHPGAFPSIRHGANRLDQAPRGQDRA